LTPGSPWRRRQASPRGPEWRNAWRWWPGCRPGNPTRASRTCSSSGQRHPRRAELQPGGVPSAPGRWWNLCMAPSSLLAPGRPPAAWLQPGQRSISLAGHEMVAAGSRRPEGTASNASRLTTRCWPGHELSAVDTSQSASDGHHDQPPVPTYSHLRCRRLPLERLGYAGMCSPTAVPPAAWGCRTRFGSKAAAQRA
jgi:hypothetical protein